MGGLRIVGLSILDAIQIIITGTIEQFCSGAEFGALALVPIKRPPDRAEVEAWLAQAKPPFLISIPTLSLMLILYSFEGG